MASLALSIVGGAFGGPLGASAGALAGSMIDQVLFPTHYPPKPQITASTYGDAIPIVYGPLNRMGCNLIWTSGFYNQIKKNDLKLLLGPIGALKSETSMVVADLALAVAAGPLMPGWCVKIWANGAVLFDSTAGTGQPTPDGNGVVTWTVSFLTYQYFDAITVYPGNNLQEPDPTMESYLGAEYTTAYRGTAYIVIKGLQVAQYGGSIPVINVLCQAEETATVGQAVNDICERSGLPANVISTSALTAELQGYQINSQSTGLGALEPLALCFDFDIAEVAGGLRFTPRGYPPFCCIENDQLAGHPYGDAQPDAYQWPRESETVMPKLAALTFNDPARDCNPNTQATQRLTGTANSNINQTVQVTLEAPTAMKITERMLWEAHIGKQGFNAPTDDRLIWAEPSRTFCIESPAGHEQVRITKASRGANGVLQLEGKRDYTQLYFSTATGVEANQLPNVLAISGPVNPPFFIEPPSDFPGVSGPTLFIALSGGEDGIANPNWQGCTVFVSTNDSDYVLVGTQLGPSMMGLLEGDLEAPQGGNPDTISILDVDMAMSDTEPPSVSAYDAGIGQNPYYVGGEYLTAENVQGLGGNSYRLTTLWRGLYGTHGVVHDTGQPFVRMDGSVFQMPLLKPYIGVPLYFRFVGAGEALTDVTTYTYSGTGNGFGTGIGGVPSAPTTPTPGAGPTYVTLDGISNVPADNVDGYTILRATGADQPITDAVVIATGVNPGTYIDPTAQPGVTYTYYVIATNSVGESTPSAGVTITTSTESQPAGMGFEAIGLFVSGELLAVGSWPTEVSFTGSNPDSYLISAQGSPAAAEAVFNIRNASLELLGTFTVAAGSNTGVLAWVTDPYVNPAKAQMFVYAPSPADATLATVNCIIAGTSG